MGWNGTRAVAAAAATADDDDDAKGILYLN